MPTLSRLHTSSRATRLSRLSLYHAGQVREDTLIDDIVCSSIWDELFSELRWPRPMCWFAVRIPFKRLLVGHADAGRFKGDVDLMGGPLSFDREDIDRAMAQGRSELATLDAAWARHGRSIEPDPMLIERAARERAGRELVWNGKMKWPPDFSAGFTAAEVKVAVFSAEGRLKRTEEGSGHAIRKQARRLCELGFDRVALVRALVTEAASVPGCNPWMVAGANAGQGGYELAERLVIKEDDPFGTLLAPLGAIPDRPESEAGAGGICIIKPIPNNPLRVDPCVDNRRRHILDVLSRELAAFPVPTSNPVVVRDCTKCKRLFVSAGITVQPCSRCG